MGVTFSLENFEYFLLILTRISSFIFISPFFGLSNVPFKVKAGLSFFITILLYPMMYQEQLVYSDIWAFAALMIKEIIVGLLIGFFANICSTILSFSGQLIDMEIGLSMINELDPVSKVQSTITANMFSNFVTLLMLVWNIHHYLLNAFVDAYERIPIGGVVVSPNLYTLMLKFMSDYLIIGFRIVLPIFASMLVINIVLAILAKVAPQMNMFVVGLQLKVLVGLLILLIMMGILPQVAEFIFGEMKTVIRMLVESLSG